MSDHYGKECPTVGISKRASSWMLVFQEYEVGWTGRSAGSILTSLHLASSRKKASVSLMALWRMETYPPNLQIKDKVDTVHISAGTTLGVTCLCIWLY